MADQNQMDLLKYLGDMAQELAIKALYADHDQALDLTAEAEELITLRTNMLSRFSADEMNAQLPLPLGFKAAA